MEIPKSHIAATLYSLREQCQTADDLDRTLNTLKQTGYQAVQISGIGPIDNDAVRGLLEKHGLFCCATHASITDLKKNLQSVILKQKTYGCDFVALAYPGEEYWHSDGAKVLADELNDIGRRLDMEGIKLGYHNHHKEFERFNIKTFLEELLEYTDPKLVSIEIDTYWVQAGGQNPVSWIHNVKDRIPVIHLKDYAILNHEPVFAEVGEGNLDWTEIVEACRYAGVRWYVVEQDKPFGDRSLFESIAISYNNMKKLGLE